MNRRWEVLDCASQLKEELSKELDIPPLIAHLLINRGITNPQDGKKFLTPGLHQLYNPFLMKDMGKGVERIISALQKKEHISIYGDYDADGITACALLLDFLRSLGIRSSYYIPHRLTEGYGLNLEAIKKIAAQGTKLLICVDCGISNHEEIQLASHLGMDTIVVDHHQVPPLPSPAYAVLDPLQPDCPYPFKGLAGVGVAFHLVVALRSRLRDSAFWVDSAEPNLLHYLDLVALGTIADVVPLVDINRVLVTYGLRQLVESLRPGIIALKEVSGIGKEEISTGHVAFRLAPRLNAGGRMAIGQMGVELLLADEYGKARSIAAELDQVNRERQGIEEKIYREAKEIIERDSLLGRKSLVLSSDNWHVGVIGIVASKLAEEFCRPAILIALEGDGGKGSGRSIIGFHLYEALQECEEHLLAFGGHKYAAGLKISRDKIEAFRDVFEETVKRKWGDTASTPTIFIDAVVDLSEITLEFLSHLSSFPPYGPANPRPIFSTKGKLPIQDIRVLGKGTLKFTLSERQKTYEVIGFGMGALGPQLPDAVRIAFHPKMNDWQGVQRLQLELRAVETDCEG
ncbi:MAG: single-stranded-DNA-specific exonuclease RecJ [Deltaproteobacteria bacterium]|nr:single-stranded-DNA-specific exonuclease RecJ [Deltaproteobacteria bacterium]